MSNSARIFLVLGAGIVALIVVGVLVFSSWWSRQTSVDEAVADTERWNSALRTEIEKLDHVEQIKTASYYLSGSIVHDTATAHVELYTDSNDPEVNIQVLNDAGRAIAVAMEGNPAGEKSWVRLEVGPADLSQGYRLSSHTDIGAGSVTFDRLADYYDV